MGIVKIKEIGKLLLKTGNMKLYEDLLSFQEKSLELEGENRNLKDEIRRLKDSMKIKDSIVFEGDAYWLKDEEGNIKSGPFCSLCYDSEEKLINLITVTHDFANCPKCKILLPFRSGKPYKLKPMRDEKTPHDDLY